MAAYLQQRRTSDTPPVAVIDIGSNSVRLVVFNGAKRAPTPLFNEKILCGLGRAVGSTGRMPDQAVERALQTLKRYAALTKMLKVSRVKAVATAAAREAENGPEFIQRATEILNTPIAVLSGREEAEYAANGVIAGFPDADGFAGDLGGGSLELISIKKRRLSNGITLPLGGLRLIDISGGNLERAAEIVDAELAKVPWLAKRKGKPFYAVGGTWRAFGRLHMAQTGYPFSVIHGYRLSYEEALKFAHLLDHLSPASMAGIEQISKARREVVNYGALVLERLLKIAKPSEVIISATGVREGYLYSLLDEDEKRRDPLIAACEELADLYARSGQHARELTRWTDQFITALGLKESREQKRLRHAACLISDIHWRAHPDYRGEQAMNLLAHGSFLGIDHPGRAFLALSSYYRHEGISDKLSPWLTAIVDDQTRHAAKLLGAALRTVHLLSAAMPGVIPSTSIEVRDNTLCLLLPPKLKSLNGERLQRRLSKLAKLVGLTGKVEITPHKPINKTSAAAAE